MLWVKTKKKKRGNRSGYDDKMLQYSKTSIKEFINCKIPTEFLALHHCLKFDETSDYWKSDLTTDEIKEVCKDLLVCNKGDFGTLLRWRVEMKKIRDEKKAGEDSTSEEESEHEMELGDGDDERDKELNEALKKLRDKMVKNKKKNA